MQVSDLRHQAASAVTTAAITPRGKLLSEFTHRAPCCWSWEQTCDLRQGAGVRKDFFVFSPVRR